MNATRNLWMLALLAAACTESETTGCNTDADCPGIATCVDRICTAPGSSEPDCSGDCGACEIDSDCDREKICYEGTCFREEDACLVCTARGACGKAKSACETDEACLAMMDCLDSCEEDSDCVTDCADATPEGVAKARDFYDCAADCEPCGDLENPLAGLTGPASEGSAPETPTEDAEPEPAILRQPECLLADPPAADESSLVGMWAGVYDCAQGKTGLRVQLTGLDEGLTAIWTFYPISENPGVASGCWGATGSFDASTATLTLMAEESGWIVQPGSYITVDAQGVLADDGQTITGQVLTPGCSSFELERQEP